MANRMGVTVRFNIEEQRSLRAMSARYRLDARGIMKLAFNLMVQSSNEFVKKQEEMKNAEITNASVTKPSVSGASPEPKAGSALLPITRFVLLLRD